MIDLFRDCTKKKKDKLMSKYFNNSRIVYTLLLI